MSVFGIFYSIGPGLGVVISSYVFQLFTRLFAAPIFIVRTLWAGFTFILQATFAVLERCVPWFTGWLQSTFPTTEKINQGVDRVVEKTIKFFEGQNFIIRFWFEFSLLTGRFLLDLVLAVYKALPHIFFVAFLLYIWFFIGYPLMYIAAAPQAAADNLNVYFEGVESVTKLFTVIYNLFALVVNVVNPFFQNTLAFFAKLIALSLRDILAGVSFENTASAGGGSRNTREELRKLSSQFTPNSPEFTDATSDLNNAWTQDNEGWEISERVFLFLESPVVQGSYAASEFLLIAIELFVALVYPIIGAIFDAIAGGGETGLCCSLTDGGGWSIGYCAARFGVSLLLSLLKIIGLSSPAIVNSINDLLPKNPPPEIPCRCSGVLKPVPPCRPPEYSCIIQRTEGFIPYYQEVVQRYKSVALQGVPELGAANPQKSIACPNFIRQEQRKSRNSRSLLWEERRLETTCETTCYKVPGKGSWLVYYCEGEGGEVEYRGRCAGDDRPIKDVKHEVIQLLKTKPSFLTPGQRQKLLHKHTYLPRPPQTPSPVLRKRDGTTTPPPTVFFQSAHPEEEEEVGGELTTEKVKQAISKLEQINIDGCPSQFNDSFEDFLLRVFCLGLRFSKLSPEDQSHTTTGIPWADKIPRHLAYISNRTELVNYHVSWYKTQTGGKESILPSVNETLTVVLKNTVAQVYEHKKKDFNRDKTKARGRKLQDPSASNVNPGSNPLTSEAPFCPYKCPAGECVARDNIASCTLPTNWTVASITRYVAYTATATTENFDGQFLFDSVIACWAGYITNPAIDPFTYRGFLEYISGSDMSSYVYCFPSFKHIPYLPDVNFKFTTFVTQLCAPNLQLNGPNAISECFCTQYNNIDVFNYAAWSTVFTPAFVTARSFNAWKVLQWLLVGWNVGFTGQFWTFFAMWANPQQSPEILYAFNQAFAAGGRTPTKNWLCAAVHSGELAFLIILLYILWIIAGYLGLLIFKYIFDLFKLFFTSFINRGLTWVSIYLYTQRLKKPDEIMIKLNIPKPGNKGGVAAPEEIQSYGKNIEV